MAAERKDDEFLGEKTEEDEQPEDEKDFVDRLKEKRERLQYAEYAMNAGEYIEDMEKVADVVSKGAEGVEIIAAAAQQVDINAVDVEQVGNIANEVANVADTVTGVTTAADAARGLAVDTIVDGHKYHSCIEDTCLEELVRCVAENCAVPCYECIATNICEPLCTCFCKCFCSAGAKKAVENTEEAADFTAEGAEGVKEALGCAESCSDALCGIFDASSACAIDEALSFALPFCGLIFSCFRLYQGVTLSCRGSIGTCRALGKAKTAFRWMILEGHARLWQGCCGLLGAAPGLIIITLPSILALSLVAGKARKIRVKIERDIAGKEDDCDPETNTETNGKQTHSFPTPEERKQYYREAYEAVSGRAKAGARRSSEWLHETVESGVSALEPEYIYPDAPKGMWSSGICQCMSHIPSCLIGCCCGCITVGQIAEAARLFKGVFFVIIVVYIINSFISLGPVLWIIFVTYLVAVSRARIAHEYNIPLNPVGNCCLAFWCTCCAATQVARHLFGWGKDGRCAGGFVIGPNPTSRWPAQQPRALSMHQLGSAGYPSFSRRVVTDARVIYAPSAVPPMTR